MITSSMRYFWLRLAEIRRIDFCKKALFFVPLSTMIGHNFGVKENEPYDFHYRLKFWLGLAEIRGIVFD